MIGLLHPGMMGAAVGAQIVAAGVPCAWLSEGRGPESRRRAEAAGLRPLPGIDAMAESCSVIISVCPPAAARDVAESVAATAFRGTFVDANAVSPRHAREIAESLGPRGVTVVDGGIVGPPPHAPDTTRLYLSGPDDAVGAVHDLFVGTNLRPVVVAGPVGRASALKLAFATYNKISQVLAAQAYALADGHGVRAELAELAGHALAHTPMSRRNGWVAAGASAWRWEPEMREIADACAEVGVPTELPHAAAAILERWREHKDDHDVDPWRLIADLQSPE